MEIKDIYIYIYFGKGKFSKAKWVIVPLAPPLILSQNNSAIRVIKKLNCLYKKIYKYINFKLFIIHLKYKLFIIHLFIERVKFKS